MTFIHHHPDQFSFSFDQRWAAGREWRLPEGRDLFKDDGTYAVDVLKRGGKPFIIEQHYAHSWPTSVLAIGLWHRSELVGVANFGNPSNEVVIPHWAGCGPREGLELNRLCLLPSVGYGGESWFIARALKIIRQTLDLKVIISYADPVQRRSIHGQIICPGHLGTVYAASNAIFCGRAAPRVKWLAPDGTVVDGRALSKISTQDQGREYAEREITRLCGVSRRSDEEPKEFLARVAPLFRRFKHKGNLVYLLPLARNARKALQLRHGYRPYPKNEVLERVEAESAMV